jgi:hypothetical protein
MRILVNKLGTFDGSENQLIALAKNLLPTSNSSLRLKFGTWRYPAFSHIEDLQRRGFQYFVGYPVCPPRFFSYRGYINLLVERIHVHILGHAGRILRSYLHDLSDHDIQAFYRDRCSLRIKILS